MVSWKCYFIAALYTAGKRGPNGEHLPIAHNARFPLCNLITAAVGKILDCELLERWQEQLIKSITLER